MQISKLLAGMTPANARLDLQTHAFEAARAALEGGSCAAAGVAGPGGVRADTEPWFEFPFLEVPLAAELLARWVR